MGGIVMKENWKKRMKKITALAVAFSSLTVNVAFAAVDWQENCADFDIYMTSFENLYEVSYLSGEQYESYYESNLSRGLYVLLVNGGFVPDVKVLLEEHSGRIFVPADVLVSTLDLTLSCGKERSYQLKKGEKAVSLSYQEGTVDFMGDTLYVPLRETIEALGGEVGYIPDFLRDLCNEAEHRTQPVRVLTIELLNAEQTKISSAEGVEKILELSKEEYQNVRNYLQETNRTFDESNRNYDPEKIINTGKRLGRFYVYQLEGFEGLPIFVNRYTGEVYSMKPGLPFVNMSQGFPNLSWLYQ